MNNDIALEKIKKYLDDSTVFFDPDKETYNILKSCTTEEIQAEEILNNLNKIGEIKEYPEFLQKFFDKAFKALEYLEEKDKEIEDIMKELEKEHEILKEELKKRGIEYKDELNPMEKYKEQTYNEKKDNISDLKDDLDKLKDKNYILKNNEKELGKAFDEELTEEIEAKEFENSKHNDEMEKINENAQNNKKQLVNPTLEDFKNHYEFMEENQTDLSRLNIEVEYKDDSTVEVKIGYKGTEVDETKQQIICNYDSNQLEYFDNEIMPYLVEKHVIESGGIKNKEENAEKETLDTVNANDEAMLIIGTAAGAAYAKKEIDENIITYVDNPEKEVKDKGIAKQIRREFYNNNGTENKGSFIIIFIALLTLITLIVFILIKK